MAFLRAPIFDFAEFAAKYVVNATASQPSLILGTSASWNRRFYEDKFDRLDGKYQRLTLEEQSTLQSIIESVKREKITAKTKDQYRRILGKYISSGNLKSVFLACTELALIHGKSFETLINGYEVFNSEELLLEILIKEAQ